MSELVDAMDSGEIAVSAAAKLAEAEEHEQQQCLATKPNADRLTVTAIKKQLRQIRNHTARDIDKAPVVQGQERIAEEQKTEVTLPIRNITINSATAGDCRDLIPALPDNSINLCLTSPPYAEQRKGLYPGVPEGEYAEFTVDWMQKLWPKLADDGSVLIVIRPHLKKGVIADYVLRTRLALREAGWNECEELVWLKPDGGACMGSNKRPRRTYEKILWFSKTHNPFIDTKACGHWEETLSFRGPTRSGAGSKSPVHSGQKAEKRPGKTRITDVISVPVGRIPKGIQHPAMFPISLAERLIQTFCPPDGTVLDPFAGSGSTLIAAKQMGSPYYGFDIMPEYAELANNRLLDEFEPQALPQAG